MRKLSLLPIILILTLFFSCSENQTEPESKSREDFMIEQGLRIVYFEDYAPYSYYDENGEMTGILVDILDECLTERLGIPLTHKGYPWARAQALVQHGSADGFVAVPTLEQRQYTKINMEPLLMPAFTIFTGAENPILEPLQKVRTMHDLRQFNHVQYLGSGWAETNLTYMNVEWLPTLPAVLEALATNEADVYVDVSEVTRHAIIEHGYEGKVVELPREISLAAYHLCLRKDTPYVRLIPYFDETIRQMRQDGTLDKIHRKYQ